MAHGLLRRIAAQCKISGMGHEGVRFATIDLERHADLCVAFRRDSFVVSFGDDQRFLEQNGKDGSLYIDWLEQRVASYPAGHVHLWRGSEIVGQIEMVVRPDGTGYVNLLYLAAPARGRGLGDVLHDYATRLFAREGITVAHLSVSPSNARALRYYEKHGWQDLGPSPRSPEVRLMRWTAPG
jgi:ribosomal protein S18 acetylase RimI-like enzyme